jgi:hypothetical protein
MNEPAFPRPSSPAHEYGFHKHQDGMTLRDYFAAKAMQGFAANLGPSTFQSRANLAYQWADAMMKARAE